MIKNGVLFLVLFVAQFDANSQSVLQFEIDSFYTYKDSTVYNRYSFVYRVLLKKIKNIKIDSSADSSTYDCEVFAFSWNGYTGCS